MKRVKKDDTSPKVRKITKMDKLKMHSAMSYLTRNLNHELLML